MQFYDLHVHSAFAEGQSSLEQLAETAKLLGYKGICFSAYFIGDSQIKQLKEKIADVQKKTGLEIFLGFEARNAKELEKLRTRRKKFDLLLVHGGDLELNRLACETSEVDLLTHPELERNDSGLNHVLVKAAAKNNVAIEINFREVSLASKKTRGKILANLQKNIELAKKFGATIVLSSGAISHFELKDPQILASFATQIGMDLKDATESVSKIPQEILKENKKRLGGKWIMPGVEVVKEVGK